jgi:hypothetical protein
LINKKDTKKRLSIRFVERVKDKFLDLGGKLTDDNGLPFADGYSIVPDGDLDVSGLGKLSAVFTQFELGEVPIVVLFGLVGFVDFLMVKFVL